MKKARLLSLLLAAVMALACFAGCGSSSNNANGDTIKIGVNYELSGDVAQYGLSCVSGIEMAINEINEAGGVLGKQIELIKIDNKSDNNEAMLVATKLATQENVSMILGPATSGATKATVQIGNQYKIPIISCSATADDVTVQNGKVQEYMFRICYSDSFQGSVMGQFAVESLAASKAIIISDSANDYSKGLADAFKESFTEKGGVIVSEENFTSTDKDFSGILTKIKDKEYDIIYLPAYYNEAGLIIKQARAAGIDKPILGADGYDDTKLVDIVGDATALNGVYFTNHYSSDDTSTGVQGFIEAYKAANNVDPNGFNALGYDMAKFAMDAITRANSTDPVEIQKALASTTNFEAVTGTFSIDENHNPVKATVIIEYKDGAKTFNSKIGA